MSLSAFALLYSELVQYHQSRVASISELERRLERSGYGVGLRVLELLAYRSREVCTFYDSFYIIKDYVVIVFISGEKTEAYTNIRAVTSLM